MPRKLLRASFALESWANDAVAKGGCRCIRYRPERQASDVP